MGSGLGLWGRGHRSMAVPSAVTAALLGGRLGCGLEGHLLRLPEGLVTQGPAAVTARCGALSRHGPTGPGSASSPVDGWRGPLGAARAGRCVPSPTGTSELPPRLDKPVKQLDAETTTGGKQILRKRGQFPPPTQVTVRTLVPAPWASCGQLTRPPAPRPPAPFRRRPPPVR